MMKTLQMLFRGAMSGLLCAVLSGCAIHFPDHCHSTTDTTREEADRLKEFKRDTVETPHGKMTVFTPLANHNNPHGAPILLLHEMPALSPDVLDCGLRLGKAGYAVYIPLLWGGEDENASSNWVFLKNAVALDCSSRWKAGQGNVDRPVIDDLKAVCDSCILKDHPGRRLGVIGNCATGILPYALAAKVPQVAAPIASQPAMPLKIFIPDNESTGLSDGDIAKLRKRCQTEPAFQLLGFRFQNDRVSSGRRFAMLERDFGSRFLDGTVPLSLYYGRDHLPIHVHSVLTGCHNPPKPSTEHAWEECQGFLKAKLQGPQPVLYSFRPY